MNRELFDKVIEFVLAHEGGHSNHPADRGGETKYGIAQRWHPHVNVRELTREQAIEIHWRTWCGRGYHQLPEDIAAKMFDLSVVMGEYHANRCLQRALRSCQQLVKEDGLLGPVTEAAVGRVDEGALLAALRSEAAARFRVLVNVNPSQEVFLEGWLNRAYA